MTENQDKQPKPLDKYEIESICRKACRDACEEAIGDWLLRIACTVVVIVVSVLALVGLGFLKLKYFGG